MANKLLFYFLYLIVRLGEAPVLMSNDESARLFRTSVLDLLEK